MSENKHLKVCLAIVGVCVLALAIMVPFSKTRAQGQNQVSTIVGQVFPNNYLAPTSAQMAAVGGVVTNPASNGIIQVGAGAAYCYGGQAADVPQVQLTLTLSTTYLVVFNCANQSVYAKTAVTGPGTLSPNQPGVPATALFATYPVEIPIATVVCGTTNCGNTANGSITDARVPSQWAVGTPTGTHLLTPASNGDVAGICTLGTSCVITFKVPYQATPSCWAQDTTAIAATKAVSSGGPPVTTLTITGTGTDVIAYGCIANPN